jgi:hypothetical protein
LQNAAINNLSAMVFLLVFYLHLQCAVAIKYPCIS